MNTLAYGALWVFVFVLPWERMVALPGISLVARATGAAALGIALFSVVTSARVRRLHAFHIAALAFVVWAGFVLLMVSMKEIPDKYWTFVQLLTVVWMIWELAPTRDRQLGLLTAYVLGAYISALDTIFLYRSHTALMRRFAAGGADPNETAMVFALGLPMAWFLGMVYRRPLMKWICRGYLPLGLLALGLTGSRGGLIAAIVGLTIVPLTLTQLSPTRRIIGMILIVVSLVVAAANTPDTLKDRLASTGSDVQEANLGGRFQIWKAGLHAFSDKPLFGYGTSGFKMAVRPYGIQQVAHNSYLSLAVEQGFVGLAIYLTMLLAIFLSIIRLQSFDRRFALVLMATMMIAMLPLTWEDQKVVWFVMAALLGFAQAPRPSSRAAQAPPAYAFHPRSQGSWSPRRPPSEGTPAVRR